MKPNDFVILKREILGVEPNSVGIIRKINDKQNLIYIFFTCPICEKGSIPDITASFVKDQ